MKVNWQPFDKENPPEDGNYWLAIRLPLKGKPIYDVTDEYEIFEGLVINKYHHDYADNNVIDNVTYYAPAPAYEPPELPEEIK